MSTAVEPSALAPTAPGSSPSLVVGSLLGAVVILAGFVAGGYAAAAVPETTPYLEVARIATYLAVVVAGIAVGGALANTNPASGVRGGVILTVSVVAATAFLASAFYSSFTDLLGQILTGAVLAGGLVGVFRLLTSQTGIGWCQAVDHQGWASVNSHKRSQGLHVRRYTMIGFLILGLTGAYALAAAEPIKRATVAASEGDAAAADTAREEVPPPLNYAVPFAPGVSIPLIPVANLTLPLLIVLGTVWGAWRAVNVPPFADFLIATEAEMNKVSWASRKRLIQDTIVVLVCLLLLTLFLLVIDLFWGWLLSLKFIGVLPEKTDAATQLTTGGAGDW